MYYLGEINIKLHIFVCINDRSDMPEPKNPDCAPYINNKELKELKNKIKDKNLNDFIKITKTYCLGACSLGGSIVLIYPQGEYYLIKSVEDIKGIIKEKLNIDL